MFLTGVKVKSQQTTRFGTFILAGNSILQNGSWVGSMTSRGKIAARSYLFHYIFEIALPSNSVSPLLLPSSAEIFGQLDLIIAVMIFAKYMNVCILSIKNKDNNI